MRKILLTGANGGIGEAICDSLGVKYEIFVLGRNESKITDLARKINSLREVLYVI